MATRRYFDGNVLREVELPDPPLPVASTTLRQDTSIHTMLAPTDMSGAPTRLPDRPVEGSPAQELKDAWAAGAGKVETPQVETPQVEVQVPPTDRPVEADPTIPNDTWTKAELGEYITANGGEKLGTNENKDVFLAKALSVYETAKLA